MNWKKVLSMEFPKNLLFVLGVENPNEDQVQGLYYALNNVEIKSKYRSYLWYRFFEAMTLQEIGELFEVPKQSVDVGIKFYLQKIKDSDYFPYIYFGYNKYSEMLKLEEKQKEEERIEKEKREKRKKEIELHKIQKRDKDIHRKRVQRKLDKNEFSMNKDIKENGYFFSLKIIPQKAYDDLFVNYKDEISARLFNCINKYILVFLFHVRILIYVYLISKKRREYGI